MEWEVTQKEELLINRIFLRALNMVISYTRYLRS